MSLLSSVAALIAFAPVGQGVRPVDAPQPANFPAEISTIVEIQAGSTAKYELDQETGLLFLDRFLSVPQGYPCHYGSVCQTNAPDGDPLDVLVFSRSMIQPGVLVKVRPIGLMLMQDGKDQDFKVIAVPTKRVDPSFDSFKDIEDLPSLDKDRLKLFFETYKLIPAGGNEIKITGFENKAAAQKALKEAKLVYDSSRPKVAR